MGTAGEAECALEMEAMRKEDSSWHPCGVSFCSAEGGLLIEFGSQDLEDMLLYDEEALTCLRFRSTPLLGDDCTHIKEGERVLATHKSQFKSNFYDAKVEKVVSVRHSKRVHCRCTFTIKWLHQDLEGETLTVPSSSIMKLATKSINVHPAVAVFLKSVKQMRSSCASPSPTVLEETDGEMDLNYLLEKQIEEISSSANASKEGISEDILLGVNVDNKEHRQWNTVTVSKVSISRAQVPHDWNRLNRSIQKSREMQIELQVEGQPPAALSIPEELPENRSHLSPLAARAALASLMSTNHGRITMDGTKMFISSVFSNMPTKDKVPSEISDASIPVISDADEMVIPLISTESKPQLVDLSSGIITKGNKKGNRVSKITNSEVTLKCLTRERNVSQPNKAARITRSAVREGTAIQNDNVQTQTCSEDMKLRDTTNKRRLTHSAINEERENLVMEVKQALEAKKSSRNTESDSLERSLSVPSNVSKKSSDVSTEKKAVSSPVTNNRRLTRSAVNEERKNLVMEVKQALEAKKSSRITESDSPEGSLSVPGSNVSKKSSGVSTEKKTISSPVTNNRTLTRSAVNEERENLVMEAKQALEAKKSSRITGSNSPEGSLSVPGSNVSKKSSGVSTEKKAISSPVTNNRRLARSAVSEERENLIMEAKQSSRITGSNSTEGSFSVPGNYVSKKSSSASTEKKAISSLVTNIKRLTRSTVNEERENLVIEVKQALEAKKSSCITESDTLEGSFFVPWSTVSKKTSTLSREKKAISSPVDAEISIPIEERNKKQMPCAVKTTQQSEGKVSGSSQDRKRKSTFSKKQEQRFSPRLKFLPRTRSQNKS
ncbi:uncharacterized protein LOC132192206 isoform X3 [Corylus avellana]|uniref:uncharacterized protein LOC132192206 isoform X3 n=1 Tax=Corylus avellana TaxID=13451 RepID=UPI00286B1367|nr:uncharacterized protein LOC132192206 isoform X3 [Corylus avellana]